MQCPRVVLNLPASLFAILGNVPRGILSTPRSAIANHTSLMFSRLVNSHSAASQGICHRGPVCLSVRFLAQHETTGNNYKQENMGHPADSFCLVSAGFVPSFAHRMRTFWWCSDRQKIVHSGLLILHDAIHRCVQLSFDFLVGRECCAQFKCGFS